MFYFFVFILGLVVGSFLNVVILRLKNGEKIINSRSHCPHCDQILAAKDLIPLVSFLITRGRCRYCRHKISWQYPLVEFFTGWLFLLATYNLFGVLGPAMAMYSSELFWRWIRDLFFVAVLVIIFVYDLRWYLILDKVTWPAIIVALAFNWWLGFNLKNLLLAAAVGLVFFGLQLVVSRGQWIGGGDLRLGVLMGAMLGWPAIIVALFFAYILGAGVAIILVALKKKQFRSAVPFGTFLSLGTLITILWGNQIISWYLSWL